LKNLTNALSRQNIRGCSCRFTTISTEAESMNTAAERLLGLSPEKFKNKRYSFFGQLRLVIAT
jgi:flotillin